ncbi:MAG: alpha/beta fold hydrolase [Fusobacteriaceae bacterium]
MILVPSLDMPLEELKKYNGINLKPKDFDEYWIKALKDLEEIEEKYTLTPSSFITPNILCYDLKFNGINNENIYVKFLIPKQKEKPLPAIIEFHGYGGSSKDWSKKLSYAEAGYVVLSMDCRDQFGETGENNFKTGNLIRGLDSSPEKLYYRNIFLDATRLVKIAMKMEWVDEKRIGTVGFSQGGALALVAAALEPKVSKVFSIYPFLSDYKRVWEMDLGRLAYEELKLYFRNKDPLHEKEEEIFTKLGYIDIQYLAPKIKGDVTLATGLIDEICPPSTQFAMYNKLNTKKKILIYPDYGHEDNIAGIYDKIYEWLLTI